MNKKEMIKRIIAYYISIGRTHIPNLQNYSKKDLEKVCVLFRLYE
jgi:hypothetical protein